MSHRDIDIGGFYLKFDKQILKYVASESISGTLYVHARDNMMVRGLFIKVIGKIGVIWNENDEDSLEIEHQEPFTYSNTFLDHRIDFLKPKNGENFVKIEKGFHEFKFSFKLSDLAKNEDPKSMFPFSSEHEYGDIRYMVTGTIVRDPKDFDYQIVEFFQLLSEMKDSLGMRSSFVPHRRESFKGQSQLFLPQSVSKVNLKVKLDKTAYMPGETLNYVIEVEDDNLFRKFTKLYVKLIQKSAFHATEPSSQIKICKKEIFSLKKTYFESQRSLFLDELIQIPQSVNPSSTLHESHNIQYKYELKVELYTSIRFVPGSALSEVKLPITIYNVLLPAKN
jgi:hypothetical protein